MERYCKRLSQRVLSKMKKVFILDIMLSYGHKKFNYYYLNILSEKFELKILNNGKYYNGLKGENITLYDYPVKESLSNSILIRHQMIKMFKYIKENNLIDDVKFILVLGYDTLVFPFFFLVCKPSVPIYVIQHHNIDDTRFILKRLAFNTYKNKIKHIVLDEEFIELLQKKLGVKSKIQYLPHYLSKLGFCSMESNSNVVVALSNSNDENKIRKLIEIDKKELLKSNNIVIYTKSNILNYKSDNLIIFKGYIDDDIYAEKFRVAKAVLILFPDTYDIRFSCTLIEGIINYKVIIGYSIPFVNICKDRYPNNVLSFSTEDEFVNILSNITNYNFDKNEREILLKRLSEQSIRKALEGIFYGFEN